MTEHTVIFQVFENCKKYTLDKFWKDHFTNLARNKFPPGIKYDDKTKTLYIKIKNKEEKIILPDENTEIFNILMDIMKNKLGIRSNRDLKIEKEHIVNITKKDAEMDDFKKIKQKQLKDHLIMNYVISLRDKYGLTNAEYNKALSIIQLGFQFKSITMDNVIYENGNIKDIEGIFFNPKTREFCLPEYTRIPPKTEKKITTDKFATSFNKFVKNNRTRVQKYI